MRALAAFPVVVPLIAAGLSLALYRRPASQRTLGVCVLAFLLAVSVVLLVHVADEGTLVVDVGGWPAPIGITLVVDRFAAIMLVVSEAMVLAVLLYAIGHPGTRDAGFVFHPIYLILAAGVALSFLTGDLFNLFVAFEVMLSASYVLITLGASREQIRPGMTYVVISLLASMLFVVTVGLVYAATGTVNLADLAGRLDTISPGLRDTLGLALLVVFGIKAAIFPVFFWLPDSYPTAPTPVTAIFAGLLTKVGVYAIIRTQTLLFRHDGPSTVILVIAGATMVVGVLGAFAQDDVKRILSFHIISQIGYMIMGVGLFTVAGVAAAIFFVANQIVIKTTLFLVGGLIELRAGTGSLPRIHGLLHRAPFVAACFLLPALSLAGLPPFSGFVAKLALVGAGTAEGEWAIVGVSLFVSLLTLLSMTKIWSGVFWGAPRIDPSEPSEPVPELAEHAPPGRGPLDAPERTAPVAVDAPVAPPRHLLMAGTTAALVAAGLAIALAAGPLYDLAEDAGADLMRPDSYVEAVMSR
jgi:multicomponent Na+:H+ antiporter subunit D